METITTDEITDGVARLEALSDDDPEAAHGIADAILLEFVPPDIHMAWHAARNRIGFWYA